jgi:hypothetical protein
MLVTVKKGYKHHRVGNKQYHPGDVFEVEAMGGFAFKLKRVTEEPKTKKEPEKTLKINDEFPKHLGSGWYRLSDGSRVRGKQKAVEAERGKQN